MNSITRKTHADPYYDGVVSNSWRQSHQADTGLPDDQALFQKSFHAPWAPAPERGRRRIDISSYRRALPTERTETADPNERAAVFTRREVVDFILDLTGYTSDKPLHRMRALEPSFGEGDFLLPAIERLLDAWEDDGRPDIHATLANAIVAVELHNGNYTKTRGRLLDRLTNRRIGLTAARRLTAKWLVCGDFLLSSIGDGFDFVFGNPPYIRHDLIADATMAQYRSRYRTITGRADIYVPFFERSLTALNPGGQLGFICSDRWMKTSYGGPLRRFVSEGFHLRFYVDMIGTKAFHKDVVAYPAITVMAHQPSGSTRVARRPDIKSKTLSRLAKLLITTDQGSRDIEEVSNIVGGNQPWIFDDPGELELVRWLEDRFPLLEEVGCKVGIGVTTGADKAFIGQFHVMDVEPDRKLPLVMTRDIAAGSVAWRGFGVINPFGDDGKLVDLNSYPRLRAYLEEREPAIAGRYIARKSPHRWYRTIDRIDPVLAGRPKLLIPDIKGRAHIVYEDGHLYPHHNLYYIVSDQWNLHALQAVLISGVAQLFVSAYSPRMRGDCLRFQAQYLRRIRVPYWHDVPPSLRKKLIDAGKAKNAKASVRLVVRLYGLPACQKAVLAKQCASPAALPGTSDHETS
ncbi:Eco57I restriction-modification methylase domain-containing protein [Hoeflea sp. EC-HK425]|uniref:Eco57I restriction-modification methylase domain-containing protein n=1 Tax=Hoeflea sp. EC-HK425 TaxID=2038388 RepID=UPI00125B0D8B|nr:Eco57I restriction-modification methylase domain-containing protein [Hoeflea sp. EC-HK425]VVT00598.1 Modification methylase PaeR7I [Hoeflea sp. EC-HK425]